MCKVIHSTDGSCRLVDFYPLPRKTILKRELRHACTCVSMSRAHGVSFWGFDFCHFEHHLRVETKKEQ
ncbi:hypothetical protein OUZ56_000481 [Daphnia magna]|uniref:Uncharacterized protein n=1 Tax=Daphnia magna TaxID=35525 RepID=A0ABQ9ZZU4_9CRUS|nr:hypothetical protein OUZ56_000481 [Daphnia magna]